MLKKRSLVTSSILICGIVLGFISGPTQQVLSANEPDRFIITKITVSPRPNNEFTVTVSTNINNINTPTDLRAYFRHDQAPGNQWTPSTINHKATFNSATPTMGMTRTFSFIASPNNANDFLHVKDVALSNPERSVETQVFFPFGQTPIVADLHMHIGSFYGDNQGVGALVGANYTNNTLVNREIVFEALKDNEWKRIAGVPAAAGSSGLATGRFRPCEYYEVNPTSGKKIIKLRAVIYQVVQGQKQILSVAPAAAPQYSEKDVSAYCPGMQQPQEPGFGESTEGMCGDGIKNDGWEECDAGTETSMCTEFCLNSMCGDGHLNTAAGEACDDGNSTGGDGCSMSCQVEVCGNYTMDVGEACDSGGMDSSTCDNNCTMPMCGDGHLNTAAGEACDDGNMNNGDGCSSSCQLSMCGNYMCEMGETNMTCPMDCWY